jgi:anti-anti-sigma regulatory factor
VCAVGAGSAARTDVILDLSGVTSIEAVALTSIVKAAKSLHEVGKLRVISPPDEVARLLADAGLGESALPAPVEPSPS